MTHAARDWCDQREGEGERGGLGGGRNNPLGMQSEQASQPLLLLAHHALDAAAVTTGSMCAGQGKPLTLVLTDVEGSTELWETVNSEAMMEAQRMHDAILRSRLGHHHG